MTDLDPTWRTGHVLSEPITSEARFELLPGASLRPRRSIDLRDRCPPVRGQKRQNCCAHAVSAEVVVNARAEGIILPEPSVDQLYAEAQIFLRPRQPLRDDGSSLRAMFLGMKERGMVREQDWPENDAPIELPPDDLWRRAQDGRILEYELLADGAASSTELYAALEREQASTICWVVDEAYANVGSDVFASPGGRVIGAHCQLVVGYDADVDAFIVRNSWSTSFGDQGYARVAASFVDLHTSEKMVCRRGPRRITA